LKYPYDINGSNTQKSMALNHYISWVRENRDNPAVAGVAKAMQDYKSLPANPGKGTSTERLFGRAAIESQGRALASHMKRVIAFPTMNRVSHMRSGPMDRRRLTHILNNTSEHTRYGYDQTKGLDLAVCLSLDGSSSMGGGRRWKNQADRIDICAYINALMTLACTEVGIPFKSYIWTDYMSISRFSLSIDLLTAYLRDAWDFSDTFTAEEMAIYQQMRRIISSEMTYAAPTAASNQQMTVCHDWHQPRESWRWVMANIRDEAGGSTPTYAGFRPGWEELARQPVRNRLLIHVTDGGATSVPSTPWGQYANDLKSLWGNLNLEAELRQKLHGTTTKVFCLGMKSPITGKSYIEWHNMSSWTTKNLRNQILDTLVDCVATTSHQIAPS
jgi:hypothetical protein